MYAQKETVYLIVQQRYRHKVGIDVLAAELMLISGGLGKYILTLDQTLESMELPAY